MNVRAPFHQQIRYEREKRNWSQEYLAEQIGVDVKTVIRWEKAQTFPRPDARRMLCETFGMDAEELGFVTNTAESAQGEHDSKNAFALRWMDWDDAPNTADFYGRTRECNQLDQWVLDDACRVIALVGAGGVGKTTLATQFVIQHQETFTSILWRSLHNAPPLEQILRQCIPFLSRQQCTDLPEDIDAQIALLIAYCKEYRCLLILDNIESIMQAGERVGKYRQGYEAYGKLLSRFGETPHQSCLILTSREKPKEIAQMEGRASFVHCLHLAGIEPNEGQNILRNKGLHISDDEATMLVHHYAGNPLALKLIAESIQSVFGGNVVSFLQEGETVFGDINDLLTQQFHRLSAQEQELLYWLAIEREVVLLEDIRANLVYPSAKATLVETLDSLYRRSMVEATALTRFSLQPVIMEYVTAELVKYFYRSFVYLLDDGTGTDRAWLNYALIKANAKEYVRESQTRLILDPVAQQLLTHVGQKNIEQRLKQALALQQRDYPLQRGYLAGNALNLLNHVQCDLRGLPLSSLVIWQAYLQDVSLHEVDARHAHFIDAVFTNTFGTILAVAFNVQGDLFAVGTATGDILVYKASNATLQQTHCEHLDAVWSVAFSPDGTLLASCSDDHTVRLWDVSTGQCLNILQKHTNRVRSIAFTPDGKMLASGGEDQNICLWDCVTGQCLALYQGHTGRVWSVAFNSDGSLLASGSTDYHIRVWDTRTGTCVKVLAGHTNWVRAVAFQHNGHLLASGGDDRMIRLWDVQTGQQVGALQGHTNNIWSIAFSNDGTLLASGSEDRTIRLWDSTTEHCIATLQGHAHGIRALVFSPDKRTLVSGGEDQTIRIWHVETGQGLTTLRGYTNRVWSATFSADSHTLASCSEDRTLRLWDIQTASSRSIQDTKHGARAIAFSPDGNILVSGGEDQAVQLWNVHTGQCLKVLHGHNAWVRAVAFSPDGATLASGGEDHTIRLWDASTGQCLRILSGHTSWVRAIVFSSDGRLLASSSDDSTIRLWEMQTGKELHILHDHTGRVRSVAFSPDTLLLASGSEDQTIRLWRVGTNQCINILHGHTNWVRSVSFSPDGRTLASSSDDYTVRLWDVENGQCLLVLREHGDRVRWVSFSPDGSMLASSSDDGSIQLWQWQRPEAKHLKTLISERPYERMNITGVRGLTDAQKAALQTLGAIQES